MLREIVCARSCNQSHILINSKCNGQQTPPQLHRVCLIWQPIRTVRTSGATRRASGFHHTTDLNDGNAVCIKGTASLTLIVRCAYKQHVDLIEGPNNEVSD